jgi:hypothetical protein
LAFFLAFFFTTFFLAFFLAFFFAFFFAIILSPPFGWLKNPFTFYLTLQYLFTINYFVKELNKKVNYFSYYFYRPKVYKYLIKKMSSVFYTTSYIVYHTL